MSDNQRERQTFLFFFHRIKIYNGKIILFIIQKQSSITKLSFSSSFIITLTPSKLSIYIIAVSFITSTPISILLFLFDHVDTLKLFFKSNQIKKLLLLITFNILYNLFARLCVKFMCYAEVSYKGTEVPYTVKREGSNVTIETANLQIIVRTDNDWVGFYDNKGQALLTEPYNESDYENGKQYTTQTDPVNGKKTYEFIQQWQLPWESEKNTALYGFGEYQNGLSNYRDATIRCLQWNTQACIPFVLSNQYWGVLWDNYAITMWNKPDEEIPLIPLNLMDGGEGGWLNYTAEFTAPFSNTSSYTYHFWLELLGPYDWPYGGNYLYVTATSRTTRHTQVLIAWTGQNALGGQMMTRMHLQPNETIDFVLFIRCPDVISPKLFVRLPSTRLDISSTYTDFIDYYFIFSPPPPSQASPSNQTQPTLNTRMDGVIQGFRLLTGAAPMYPIWAYGFWQCRERYHNQSEILGVFFLKKKKKNTYWQYWGDLGWGPQWDPEIYPRPQDMVTELHAMNFKLMVSVWSNFQNQPLFIELCTITAN
ncbi:hypothetical protein RFI_25536 [Reticulomyxa filosa]|uniref:Uncharacterized protein n=1 Tax=Reticulomyxa filosa TaxID=46433 RepID=X6MD74_RETFI|nr:hypothetical protein RFI_25536 [Reticulomyxa filosa]|eukprot:ETO11839.1 hypothetical protein RFI_25536 [Reticulomyxa filosa]